MKKTFVFAGIAAAIALVGCESKTAQTETQDESAAQEVQAAPGSIVFFNMDKVMEGYDMANDITSVFETKTSGIQAEIDRRGKKLEKDAADFQNKVDKGLMTSSTAQVQYQKLQQQQQDYQQYAMRKQQEMAEEQQVNLNKIADAIAEYIKEYNAEHGYAMILATAGGILPTPVVTADPSLDITEDLLAGLNQAYIRSKEAEKK